MERSDPSADDDLYVLRCSLPPSAGGVRYVRSYGLYRRSSLELTDVVEAALRLTARDAPPICRELREKYGLDVEPYAVGPGREGAPWGPGPV
jgi:hypothetical protein